MRRVQDTLTLPWHFLNFFPDPHQQGSLRPTWCSASTTRCSTTGTSSCSSPPPIARVRLRAGRACGGSRGGDRAGAHRGCCRPSRRPARGAWSCRRPRTPGWVGHRPACAAVLALDVDLDVEDHARVVGPDAVDQVPEEGERLVLVGYQRIDLGEAAQVDALAQVVHVEQVLAPAFVDDLQQQDSARAGPSAPRRAPARARRSAPSPAPPGVRRDGRGRSPRGSSPRGPMSSGKELRERREHAVDVPVLEVVALGVLLDRALDHARRSRCAPARPSPALRAPRRGRRRSRAAARSSRRRIRARACGSGSSVPRPCAGLFRSAWRASPPRSVPRCPPRRPRRVCRGCGRCGRPRTAARGRPRRRGRSGSRPGRPGARSARAAGCRCAATRGARCRR